MQEPNQLFKKSDKDPNAAFKTFYLDGSNTNSSGGVNIRQRINPLGSAFWNNQANVAFSTSHPYLRNPTGLLEDLTSIQLNGTSARAWTTNSQAITAMKFGAGNFTLSTWLRMPDVSKTGRILEFNGGNGIAWSDWLLWKPSTANQLNFSAFLGGSYFDVGMSNSSTYTSWGSLVNNTWHHIEINRAGNNWYCFQDGILRQTFVKAGTIPDRTIGFVMGAMFNTSFGTGTLSNYWGGSITGFEVYKGFARHTSNFAVPTFPYID